MADEFVVENPISPPRMSAAAPRVRLRVSRELALGVLIVATGLVAGLLYPRSFASVANLTAVMRNLALDGVLALGMMLLFVGGTFDLSVGGTFSMVGVMAGYAMKDLGLPVPVAVGLGLSMGAAAGLINGLIVTRVRVNALIATLATMLIYRGVAVLIGGPGISYLPAGFAAWGQRTLLGIQAPFWLLLALAVTFHLLLARTRMFRQYYYVGSNARAAHLSGIPVDRLRLLGFTIMGALAGLAGMAFAARIGTAVSTAGDGAELRIITAVILGGASLRGGRGTIPGALIGVLFIALVNNVLIIASVSSYWQSIVTGVVLVLAVATDALLNRRNGRQGEES